MMMQCLRLAHIMHGEAVALSCMDVQCVTLDSKVHDGLGHASAMFKFAFGAHHVELSWKQTKVYFQTYASRQVLVSQHHGKHILNDTPVIRLPRSPTSRLGHLVA